MLCFFIGHGLMAQEKVTITIDTGKTFQTIEGFGAFNTISQWRHETAEKKYDMLAGDLGLSILRFELPPTFQPVQDSSYDLRGKVFGGPDLQHNFEDVRQLRNRGVTKFIATIWSPPAWMKTLNKEGKGPTTSNGGHLREDRREDLAAYCAAYCRIFKKETGVDLYALGIQNEPEFAEPYNSCKYNPEQLREALRYVGRKFRQEGITTKIYVPEALPAQKHLPDFFNAINNDTETRKYADIFAIHNYDADGMNVGGAGAREWEAFAKMAAAVEPVKEVWMTETSGHANNWTGAMLLAANIYNALEYGNLSAWLWWSLADNKSSEVYGLIIDGKPTGRYYASKQYYHFIRPGAVRVDARSDQADVLVLAFTHSADDKLVTVLINKGETEKEIRLPKMGSGGKITAYLSTDTLQCALQKKPRRNKVVLPAKSVMTITWR
jgi:O-glycosyl hydrolase